MTMYPGHRSTPGCSRSPRTWSTKAINKSANCWSGSVPPAHWQPSNTPGPATNRRLRCHVWNGFSCRIVLEPGPELRARQDWTAHEHRQSRDCVLAGLGYTTAGSAKLLRYWCGWPIRWGTRWYPGGPEDTSRRLSGTPRIDTWGALTRLVTTGRFPVGTDGPRPSRTARTPSSALRNSSGSDSAPPHVVVGRVVFSSWVGQGRGSASRYGRFSRRVR